MLDFGFAPLDGVLAGREKYIHLPLPELYDLGADRGETSNLVDRAAERARVLAARLADFHASAPGAPQPEAPGGDRAPALARLRVGIGGAEGALHRAGRSEAARGDRSPHEGRRDARRSGIAARREPRVPRDPGAAPRHDGGVAAPRVRSMAPRRAAGGRSTRCAPRCAPVRPRRARRFSSAPISRKPGRRRKPSICCAARPRPNPASTPGTRSGSPTRAAAGRPRRWRRSRAASRSIPATR